MRRPGALSLPYLISLFCCLAATAHAASSVLGIDFGTLNLKAVLVKPGIPLEIVLAKDSKRKETAAVAFKPRRDSKNNIIAEAGTFPERLYGGDALSLQGRLPGEVFPNLKPLLSGSADDETPITTYHSRYPSVKVQRSKELDTTTIKSEAFVEDEGTWGVEELLAMEFANMRRNAERLAGAGSSVQDTVITIPAFYTSSERRAIQRAARLAGLTVTALVSDGLAVGLDYAKSRTFPEVTAGEKAEHHIVYDMGAGSTTATLLRFQSRSVKDVGKFNKTVQEVAVLGTGWDQTLGGDGLNDVLLDEYISKFLTKPEVKAKGTQADEIRSNGRVMSRLWKDVEKARQVLSANTETGSSFEELLPDIDFRVKISRAEFETLASDFANRVTKPIDEALKTARLDMSDVDSIILHGGAVRTPFVQKKLEAFAGGSKLKTNVNADESAVFGVAFKGAGISPSFKVKEIRDSDLAGYAAGIIFKDGGKSRRQGLFTPASPVGSGATTKQVTLKDKDDLSFSLYQSVDGVDVSVATIETTNLTASVKELHSKFGCEKDDITTKFSIRLSAIDGLPEVVGGSVSCEVEGSGKTASVGDSVKDWLGLGKKKDQEPLQADGTDGPIEEVDSAQGTTTGADTTTSASSADSSSSSKTPEKPKKRTETIPVRFSVTLQQPQGKEDFQRISDRLGAFDRSDRARFAREEALNVLESYTYFVRDFLSNDEYRSFSTDDERSALDSLLDATREFMDSPEAAKAVEKELKEKHKALKQLVEPIQKRKKEAEQRPDAVRKLREALEQIQKFVEVSKERLAKAASETTTSSADASTTTGDSLDDLEEASDAKPNKNSALDDLGAISQDDVAELFELYDTTTKWLEEGEAAQTKLKPFDDPTLVVKEIEAKLGSLSKATASALYKTTNKPSGKGKKAKTAKAKSSKTKTSTATETPEAESDEKPKIVTVNPGDDMPTEEEILQMIKDAEQARKADPSTHDEL